MDESQRAMAAAKRVTTTGRGRPAKKENGQICPITGEKAAEDLNVSPRSVKSARAVLKSGDADLIAQVEAGRGSGRWWGEGWQAEEG